MMKRVLSITLLSLPSLAPLLAQAANPFSVGSDVQLRVDAGRIRTDGFDDNTLATVPGVRAFGWMFGTVPGAGNEYFLNDPGFNVPLGAGFAGGLTVRFDAVRPLRVWGGSGAVNFSTPPAAGETLRIFRTSVVFTEIGASTPTPAGFSAFALNGSGTSHTHLKAVINGADGNAIAGDGVEPTPGIYLTFAQLSAPGTLPTDPIAMAFGVNRPATELSGALQYIANPLPGDATYDSRVDISDFAILAANFGTPAERFWYDGDFNSDRAVNIADFALLAAGFGNAAPAVPLTVSVPEPAVAGFCVLTFAPLLLRRR